MSATINKAAIPRLRNEFLAKQPYRFASVGDLFSRDELLMAAREIDEHIESIPEEKSIYASHRKFKQSSLELMPTDTPEGIYRKSIAMYYYSATRPSSDIRLGKSNMTNYVERPDETFAQDRVRRIRHKLQLMIKRLLDNLARRS